MSIIQFALNKDAVSFQKALHERLEAAVDIVLEDTKIDIANALFNEGLTGIVSSAGGVSTRAAGGEVGKDRIEQDLSSDSGITPGGTHISGVTKKPDPSGKGGKSVPGDNSTFTAVMPGKANEETEPKKEPSERHMEGKGKRAMRMMMKKKYDKKRTDESVSEAMEKKDPSEQHSSGKNKRAERMMMKKKYDKKRADESVQIDEKIIAKGSVDHMAHAVHACASGHCEAVSHRGSFTHYNHPDYAIHKDHGGISTEPAVHNYYVVGHGGVHKFKVEHTKHGVDVSHGGKVS